MRESFIALTILDRNNINEKTTVGAWVRQWWHCSGRCISVSHCLSSKAYMAFVCCDEEVEYQRAMWDLTWSYFGRDVLEVFLSLIVLRRPFHLFYLIERLEYWWHDFEFKYHLRTKQRLLMVDWHKVEISAVHPASHPVHCVMVHSSRRPFEGKFLLLVVTLPVFSYYSHYVLNDHDGAQLTWRIAMSDVSVCSFTAFLCLALVCPASAERGLVRPVSAIKVGRCRLCLVSVKNWGRWALWWFCAILVPTWP